MNKIGGREVGGRPPGPNFGLIVALAGVFIIVGILIAYLFAGDFAKHIHAIHPDKHPTSQLVMPRYGSLSV